MKRREFVTGTAMLFSIAGAPNAFASEYAPVNDAASGDRAGDSRAEEDRAAVKRVIENAYSTFFVDFDKDRQEERASRAPVA